MTQWLMALEEEGALQRLARFRRRRMIPSIQGPRQLRWCVAGILKAKKGNSEERKRDFETNHKLSFLREMFSSRAKNTPQKPQVWIYCLTVFVSSNECKNGASLRRAYEAKPRPCFYSNQVFLCQGLTEYFIN